jgi:hypothetical protein
VQWRNLNDGESNKNKNASQKTSEKENLILKDFAVLHFIKRYHS